jgi:hypothetical protein
MRGIDNMSKVETLKASVAKAETKVEKCKATIVRHENALEKKIAKLEKVSERTVDLDNVDAHKWDENHKSYDYYWEACEVSSKLEDIKGAKKKLKEAEIVLSNWEAKLEKEIEKDNFIGGIPQVIKNFLEMWKEQAYEWHIQRLEKFVIFKKDLYRQEKEASAECQGLPYRERRAYMEEKGLDNIGKRLLSFGGVVVVEMDRIRNEEDRLAYLNKVLEDEKRRKAIDLVNRITEVVGTIEDASRLDVSAKGNLDGIIYGSLANAKIETIGAGGYNIQCFHYRTLVNKI